MRTNFNEGKVYIVTWGDAWARPDYYESEDDHTPMVMKDIGWLCEENDETVVLCRSIAETGQRRQLTIIPWCNVISIEELVCRYFT